MDNEGSRAFLFLGIPRTSDQLNSLLMSNRVEDDCVLIPFSILLVIVALLRTYDGLGMRANPTVLTQLLVASLPTLYNRPNS